jgi:hypothetical protein
LDRLFEIRDAAMTPGIHVRRSEQLHAHEHVDGTDVLLIFERGLGGADRALLDRQLRLGGAG